MAYHRALCTLAALLLAACATRATTLVDSATLSDTVSNPDLALAVDVTRAMELFGNTFLRAFELYKENSEDLKHLKTLPDLVAELKNEIRHLKKSIEDNRSKVSESTEQDILVRNQIENFTNEIAELKKEIHDMKSSVKDNSSKISEGTKQDILIRNELVNLIKEPSAREKELQKTLEILADQLTIKEWVHDYDHSKDWRAMRRGLEEDLDHDSPAFAQLQNISWTEAYAPWQIAFEGHYELVTVLVFAGKGINMTDRSKDNMLHGAVAGGQVRLVEMLLDNGAWIESRNAWGNAPLHLACKYRHLDVARLLFRRGAEVDGVNYEERWAGLARAADNGYLEIVKFMVEAGASTTLKDKNGHTPLEVAKHKGHAQVVEYLSQFPH